MEEAFDKLKKDGNNSVDSLIKWMKDSKLITETKVEDQARKLFEDVSDAKNVQLEKFKEVVGKLAADQKKTADEFTKMLGEQGAKLFNAAKAGVSAFKDAMAKK